MFVLFYFEKVGIDPHRLVDVTSLVFRIDHALGSFEWAVQSTTIIGCRKGLLALLVIRESNNIEWRCAASRRVLHLAVRRLLRKYGLRVVILLAFLDGVRGRLGDSLSMLRRLQLICHARSKGCALHDIAIGF